MTAPAGFHEATFYVQVAGSFFTIGGTARVRSLSAVAMTQKRPTRPRPGTVTVKLTVRVPDAALLPLAPEAVIVIPETMVLPNPIEVEAEDPAQ